MCVMGYDDTEDQDSRRRILVVSHDLILRERLYDLLVRHGYSVKTIDSGRRTIASLRHERPDLILADTSITDCRGWGLPDRIRIFDELLPIVLLTPLQGALDAIDARTAADVQSVLPSDVSEDLLITTIRQHAKSRRPAEQARLSGTALLVDDEPQLLQTLRTFLPNNQSEALACAGGLM